jgi:hypothetical protein
MKKGRSNISSMFKRALFGEKIGEFKVGGKRIEVSRGLFTHHIKIDGKHAFKFVLSPKDIKVGNKELTRIYFTNIREDKVDKDFPDIVLRVHELLSKSGTVRKEDSFVVEVPGHSAHEHITAKGFKLLDEFHAPPADYEHGLPLPSTMTYLFKHK